MPNEDSRYRIEKEISTLAKARIVQEDRIVLQEVCRKEGLPQDRDARIIINEDCLPSIKDVLGHRTSQKGTALVRQAVTLVSAARGCARLCGGLSSISSPTRKIDIHTSQVAKPRLQICLLNVKDAKDYAKA